jgi:peptide deformylase
VAVVTQPDKPKGRGRALAPPPVKETALHAGLRVLQPERIGGERGAEEGTEGCLSVPGVEGTVKRAAEVDVEGQDEYGRAVRMTGKGILARALQHEIDHLDGVLFIRRVAPAKP